MSSEGNENVENYVNGLKVVELREELKKRGITSYGVKSVLVERLIEALTEEKEKNSQGEEDDDKEADGESELQPCEAEAQEPSAHAQENEEDQDEVAEPGDAQPMEPAVQPTDAETEETVVLPNEEAKGEESEQHTEDEDEVYVEIPGTDQENSTSDELTVPSSGKETTSKEESEEEPMEASEPLDKDERVEVLDSVEGEPAEESEEKQDSKKRRDEDRERDRDGDDDEEREGRGRGHKRDRDREDRDRDRPKRFDPRHAPDPEEPLHFDEDKMRLLVPKDFVPPENDAIVTLNPYHSSLYFAVSEDGKSGCGLTEEGFQYLWAGSRASWGVKNGRYYYECQIDDKKEADLPDGEESYHDARVGWSVLHADTTVGESRMSFAYCKNGTFICNGRSVDYGAEYDTGDVITCYIDLTKLPGTVSFSKNGEDQGIKDISTDSRDRDRSRRVFFPHVSVKNIKVSLNFGELPSEQPAENGDDNKASKEEEEGNKPSEEEAVDAKPSEEEKDKEEETTEKEEESKPAEKAEVMEVETAAEEKQEEDATEEKMEGDEEKSAVDNADEKTSEDKEEAAAEDKPESSEEKIEEKKPVSKEEKKEEEVEEYKPIQQARSNHKERAPRPPSSRSSCEVILLIGLPSSGKTTWAQKFCRDQGDKPYEILGPDMILDKMGLGRVGWKENYETLLKQANEIVNNMLILASESRRNVIIDQTNVYRTAQERKVGYFKDFHTRAVLVIPPHHELRRRRAERRGLTGYEAPENDLKAMKANFFIPRKTDGIYDEIQFSEIYGLAAEKIVSQYKDDALDVPYYPPPKRGRYEHRGGREWGSGSSGSYYRPRPQYGGYPPYSHYGHPPPHYYPPPPRPYGGYHPAPRPYPQYGHGPSSYMAQRGGRYNYPPPRSAHYGQPGPRGGYYSRY